MTQALVKPCVLLLSFGALLAAGCTTREIEIRELRVELTEPYAPAEARVVGQVVVPTRVSGTLKAAVTFGDGSAAVNVDLDSSGHFTLTHTYSTKGTFEVLVDAEMGTGTKGSASARAEVLEPLSGLAFTCGSCDAQGVCTQVGVPTATEANPACHVPGPSVTMTASSHGGFNALQYHWNFGDGSMPMDGVVVRHEFRATGTYTVTVVAQDSLSSAGSQMAITKQVVVESIVAVAVDADMGFTGLGAGKDVHPAEASANIVAAGEGPFTLLVTWGDGSNSVFTKFPGNGNGYDATHTYLAAGVFSANFSAVDRLGNVDTRVKTITIR